MRKGWKGKKREGKRGKSVHSPAKSFDNSIPTLATIVKPKTSSKNANGLSTVEPCSVFTATASR